LRVGSTDVKLQAMNLGYIQQVDGAEKEKDWPEY
jgi:hypothetical protein